MYLTLSFSSFEAPAYMSNYHIFPEYFPKTLDNI